MYFSISRRSKIAPDFGDIQGCSGTSFDTAKKGAIEDVYYEGRNITLLFCRPDAAFAAIERKHGRNQWILTTAHQRHRLLTTWEGFLQVNLCKTVYNYNIKRSAKFETLFSFRFDCYFDSWRRTDSQLTNRPTSQSGSKAKGRLHQTKLQKHQITKENIINNRSTLSRFTIKLREFLQNA